MLNKEFLANQIYGNDAEEVLFFLAKVAPDKHEFRNEKKNVLWCIRLLSESP